MGGIQWAKKRKERLRREGGREGSGRQLEGLRRTLCQKDAMTTLENDALFAVLFVGRKTSRMSGTSGSLALVTALLHCVALANITVHQIHPECITIFFFQRQTPTTTKRDSSQSVKIFFFFGRNKRMIDCSFLSHHDLLTAVFFHIPMY